MIISSIDKQFLFVTDPFIYIYLNFEKTLNLCFIKQSMERRTKVITAMRITAINFIIKPLFYPRHKLRVDL